MKHPSLTFSLDLDGTILNYGDATQIRFNPALIPLLHSRHMLDFGNGPIPMSFDYGIIGIATNQAGLVLNAKYPSDPHYPTPPMFIARLTAAIDWLKGHGYYPENVRVSLYHHIINRSTIEKVAQEVRDLMPQRPRLRTVVYTTARARKPSGMMLRAQRPMVYLGDSASDRKAADDANIPFVLVPRFTT